jgi:hypothetical protein
VGLLTAAGIAGGWGAGGCGTRTWLFSVVKAMFVGEAALVLECARWRRAAGGRDFPDFSAV